MTKPRSEASLYIEVEILVEDGGGRHPTCTGAAVEWRYMPLNDVM